MSSFLQSLPFNNQRARTLKKDQDGLSSGQQQSPTALSSSPQPALLSSTPIASSSQSNAPFSQQQLQPFGPQGFQASPGSFNPNLMSSSPTSNSNNIGTVVGAPTSGLASQILRQHAETTLGSGALRQAVMLPEGEDLNEWVAVHVVDFYNQINMLYGTITEFCSPKSCPRMLATEEYEYLWQDGARYKKPTKMSAPEYAEHLMEWVQAYIEDEAIFPTRMGKDFSKDAPQVFRNILKRLFRIYAHIYCHHFDQVDALGILPHLNTSLKHFILFTNQFKLVDQRELAPLRELIVLLLSDGQQ